VVDVSAYQSLRHRTCARSPSCPNPRCPFAFSWSLTRTTLPAERLTATVAEEGAEREEAGHVLDRPSLDGVHSPGTGDTGEVSSAGEGDSHKAEASDELHHCAVCEECGKMMEVGEGEDERKVSH
jgi:hypothetical protein